EDQPVEHRAIAHRLAPDAGLHPEQPFPLALAPAFGGIEAIGRFGRGPAGPARPAFVPILAVRHVEVVGLARRDHHVVTLGRELLARLHAVPADHVAVRLVDAAALGRFLPGAGDLAARGEEGLYALQK